MARTDAPCEKSCGVSFFFYLGILYLEPEVSPVRSYYFQDAGHRVHVRHEQLRGGGAAVRGGWGTGL